MSGDVELSVVLQFSRTQLLEAIKPLNRPRQTHQDIFKVRRKF
jgi:hypothetical protein